MERILPPKSADKHVVIDRTVKLHHDHWPFYRIFWFKTIILLMVTISIRCLKVIPYPPKNKPPPLFDPQVLAQVRLPRL